MTQKVGMMDMGIARAEMPAARQSRSQNQITTTARRPPRSRCSTEAS